MQFFRISQKIDIILLCTCSIQKFLEFVRENELVVPCKLYDDQEDVMTTPIGRDMGLRYLNYIFHRIEEVRCWTVRWPGFQMKWKQETKEPSLSSLRKLMLIWMMNWEYKTSASVDTVFPYYKIGGCHPAFFDDFYRDTLVFPKEHQKNTSTEKICQVHEVFSWAESTCGKVYPDMRVPQIDCSRACITIYILPCILPLKRQRLEGTRNS